MTATSMPTANDDTAPIKRQLVEAMLQQTPPRRIQLFVNHHHDAVKIGTRDVGGFRKYLRLLCGHDLQVPITDLQVDADGISGGFRFWRRPAMTVIPWAAVFAIYWHSERSVCYWPGNFPALDIPSQLGGAEALSQLAANEAWPLWRQLPEVVRWCLELYSGLENDQALITEGDVRRLSSSAAALLLRIDAAMQQDLGTDAFGNYHLDELPSAQRGVERRQLSVLYHQGLVNSSRNCVWLSHELSPEARAMLTQLARKEQWKRDAQTRAAVKRAVQKDERAGYAEALGLQRDANADQIVTAIQRLRAAVPAMSPRGRRV